MSEQDEFDHRMRTDADLDLWLSEQIWNLGRTLRLNGQEYEPVGYDEVPGYDEDAVLLRRESDGKVFEVEFDVSVRPVREVSKP